jgi:hypothetical protein
MKRKVWSLVSLLALLRLAAACADTTAPPTFAISAIVDRASALVGDSVTFTIHAQGNLLVTLGVNFGDGSEAYSRDLGGATLVTANLRHAFPSVGQYTVSATVFAANGDSRQATVGVQVR